MWPDSDRLAQNIFTAIIVSICSLIGLVLAIHLQFRLML